ncbi:hypothetical protein GCM10009037_30680 [Halarchaeum grantii]|uniref:Uncharacterized protein n=1 Tax=Halarchaeum grantii TaxID=1193105 RepID=A0A830F187_9EURY|nr:hypothetical protein GCM10009037_30680 [Halarchaeum grantii]
MSGHYDENNGILHRKYYSPPETLPGVVALETPLPKRYGATAENHSKSEG